MKKFIKQMNGKVCLYSIRLRMKGLCGPTPEEAKPLGLCSPLYFSPPPTFHSFCLSLGWLPPVVKVELLVHILGKLIIPDTALWTASSLCGMALGLSFTSWCLILQVG